MCDDVKERLLAGKRAAATEVEAVLVARDAEALTRGQVRRHVLAYVLAKFALGADEAPSRNLEALAEASLAKALATDPARIAETDRSPTCDGASSVDMKQALLVMAVQREFGVQLDGLRAGLADTTDDLADLLFEALAAS